MLTSITIQNFKGIGDPVTIPIRPLTIMFGKNSAGKSTVVQALHYAREVLLHKNPNADRTALGGSSIDLGGFQNILHRRSKAVSEAPLKPVKKSARLRKGAKVAPKALKKLPEPEIEEESPPIILKFEFELDEFPRYSAFERDRFFIERLRSEDEEDESSGSEESGAADLLGVHLGISLEEARTALRDKGDAETDSAAVELEVRWSRYKNRPIVTRYETWLGGESAGRITTSIDGANTLWEINVKHRFLRAFDEDEFDEVGGPQWDSDFLLVNHLSMPAWGEIVGVEPEGFLEGFNIGDQTATEMIAAPGEVLVGLLDKLTYIGPIREIPPRNFQPRSTGDEAEWASGLAAWSDLYSKGHSTVDEVSTWMSEHLKTGYSLEMEVFKELDVFGVLTEVVEEDSTYQELRKELRESYDAAPNRTRVVLIEDATKNRLLPRDIGVGVSQVIPVVVAAATLNNRLIAIEQPELHLHPAVQSELGDLFITCWAVNSNQVIVETHSEHLILRVLRRIRETSSGTGDFGYEVETSDLSLLYVGRGSSGTEILSLNVDKRGRIIDRVPGGFFEEDFAEIF